MSNDDEDNEKDLEFDELMFSKPFNYFSFYVGIKNENKMDLYQNYIIEMLKAKIKEQKKEIKHYQNNSKSVKLIISDENKATHLEELRKIQVAELKAQIEEEKQKAAEELSFTISDYEARIDKIEKEYAEYRKVTKEEIKVNESIRYQQKIEINKLKTDIKRLK